MSAKHCFACESSFAKEFHWIRNQHQVPQGRAVLGGLCTRSLSSQYGWSSLCICAFASWKPSQVRQSDEDETCVPADCSSSSTSEPTTITTNGTVSTILDPIAQTTLPSLILTTMPAGPIDCLLVMTTALSER